MNQSPDCGDRQEIFAINSLIARAILCGLVLLFSELHEEACICLHEEAYSSHAYSCS